MTSFVLSPVAGRRDGVPAEVCLARVHDRGKIEFLRRDLPSFWLSLGETTQQDLLTELGPPDSTYKKSVRNNAGSYKKRTGSTSSRRSNSCLDGDRGSNAVSETDGSDVWSDDDDDEDQDEAIVVNEVDKEDAGIWWNYYSHGFDVLISQAQRAPLRSPTASRREGDDGANSDDGNETIARNHLTATKMIIHSNVPGSYQFNRHRRLRWTLESWPYASGVNSDGLTSETKFWDIQARLRDVFKHIYENEEEEKEQQQPLAINRDWGEGSSLGSSVELLGGWEESKKRGDHEGAYEFGKIGEVLVFGFPGLAFEVLKTGVVSQLQVW